MTGIATGVGVFRLEEIPPHEYADASRGKGEEALEGRAEHAAITPVRPALGLSNISLTFGGIAALRDIDLDVAEGEIRAVIGPNGAGKSSLLNIVSGLYRPDRGEVWFGERFFREVPTSKLAALGVARTFQNLARFKGLSVFDNVLMGLAHRLRAGFVRQIVGSPLARRIEAENRAAAQEVIGFLHLAEVHDQPCWNTPLRSAEAG
ncbi:ABC-type branched-subunit amino acid transport system ATPase component [Bradyrhizobium sp. USDA 10063]